eukprot:TRINITY_DN71457_c0_g1_i1.p1 TRINITY_DN71457_c0_g1~~TRINITY_DN71457_c0_g1_i1.p1  ORF type:complete len:794 (+),score=136.86 TRINITY_DN71457_c0_g1_i1:171-2384(+)
MASSAGLASGKAGLSPTGVLRGQGGAEVLDSRAMLDELSEDELLQEDDEDSGADGEQLASLSSPVEADTNVTPVASPYLVKLRRESVPIYRRGKIASFKTSYSGVLRLGSPAQAFRVVFDTGSGNVVVPATTCQSESCLVHRRFNSTLSETAMHIHSDGSLVEDGEAGETVTIGFGTGEITGEFVRDKLCIVSGESDAGDGANATLSEDITNASALAGQNGTGALDVAVSPSGPCLEMNVIVAVEMSTLPFKTFNFDGILGLGLGALAMGDDFSLFGLLSQQVGSPRFGAFLTDGEDGEESEMAFGGYNPERLLEPLSWAPVQMADMGYWIIEILAVRVNGQELDMCSDGTCRGVVDTGTSHLGIPAPYDVQINDMLRSPAGDLLDCRLADAPEVQFELRGFNITINPSNYMRRLPLRDDVQVGSAHGVHLAPEATIVSAPKGELGFAFDDEQRIVNISATSPLLDKVQVGDKIESVNGISVAGYSSDKLAATLTELSEGTRALRLAARGATQTSTPAARNTTVVKVPAGPLGVTFDANMSVVDVPNSSFLYGKVDTGDVLLAINGALVENSTLEAVMSQLSQSEHEEREMSFALAPKPLPANAQSGALVQQNETAEAPVQRFCSPRTMAVRLPEPLGPKLFILGEPILHRYYTVYDWKAEAVGFGLANNKRNTMNPADLVDKRGVLPKEVDMLLMQQRMVGSARVKRATPDDGEGEDEIVMMQVTVSVGVIVKRMA